MADLAEIQREIDETNLSEAIRANDKAIMAACLRRLGGQIPPDISNKLADYIDPAIENPTYKRGPKERKEPFYARCYPVMGFYYLLRENPELARFFRYRKEEVFHLADNSKLFDAVGNFAPQWKYPQSKRKRDTFEKPTGTEIESLVCKEFGICSRTFSDLRKAYRK